MKTHAYLLIKPVLVWLALATAILPTMAMAEVTNSEVLVPVHRSELVSVPAEISEVIISNPDIADVYVHGMSKVSVVGKAVGTTNLRILDKQSRTLRSLAVRVTYDLPAIRQALYQFFPYEDIAVQMVSNNIALTGMVSSASVAQKAVRIANEFLLPLEENQRPRNDAFALTNAITEEPDTGVINMLKITSGQQVMLRVRVGEIQRNALKQLGVSWSGNNPGNFQFGTGTDLAAEVAGDILFQQGPEAFGVAAGIVDFGNTTLSVALDALERNNLFKLLAEPNLVAMSGEDAEFLSGGEFPIPVVTDERINIEYREFGVSVRFRPHVLSDSRIRLNVAPEVSELTETGSVQISGVTIPALNIRRARTTVELAPGESFMIAGLLKDTLDSTVDQVPGVGEVPLLSALFRSTNFERNETELVIAVTPYLVDPVTGEDVRLPTDNFRPASMMEQFFYGALGSLSKESIRISQTPPLEGPIGFMVD